MDVLIKINSLAESNNIVRTITNFSFKDNQNIYGMILNDINGCYQYGNLKLSQIDDIHTVLYCGIKKNTTNKNICFINYNLKDVRITKPQIKNVNVKIIRSNDNTAKILELLLNTDNFFRKFVQKKHYKQRNSFTLVKKNYNSNCTFKYDNIYYSKIVTQEKHVIKTTTIIKCHIIEERIEFSGRIMLPNSLTIIFKDRSRIILYNTNKITLIFVKNIELEATTNRIDNILNNMYKLYNLHTPVTYTDVSLYFDFMYTTSSNVYTIPSNKFNIRFISNNKIMIHKITTIDDMENIIEYIKYLEEKYWPDVYKLLQMVKNPFKTDKQTILNIINKLWETQ